MTAIKGMTWVYNEIYLNTQNPDIYISEAGWDDNPWLTEEQKAQMARGLTPQALKVRREGKFVKQTGLVAAWFNRAIHVVDIKELPLGDTYSGGDFGFSAPTDLTPLIRPFRNTISGRCPSRRDDRQLQERQRELAREHPHFGYRRLHLYRKAPDQDVKTVVNSEQVTKYLSK